MNNKYIVHIRYNIILVIYNKEMGYVGLNYLKINRTIKNVILNYVD